MAFVLENDAAVLKWLRPGSNQFRIYWDNNSKRYEPDFIVETADAIYMIEPKASNMLTDQDVLQKMEAAKRYCKYATDFTKTQEGKPWYYLLVPHTDVSRTISLSYLITKYK
jgi:type III restriction enzyme